MADIGCAECNQAYANMFCICQQNPVFLCNACISTHYSRFNSTMHDLCPLKDLLYLQQISPQVYRQKKLAIAQSMILVDMLENKEASDYQELKNTLNQLFQQAVNLTDSLHGAITATLQDVKTLLQQSLYEETNHELIEYMLGFGQALQKSQASMFDVPVLTTMLSTRLALETSIAQFANYDFQQYILARLKDARTGRCSLSAIATVRQEEQDNKYCPVLMGNILRKYYAGKGAKLGLVELTHVPDVDQESGYAFLETGHLFVCGGLGGKRSAYIIGHNSQVTILPSLTQGRSCPGVICFRDSPFVFGGSNGSNLLTTCEKFANLEQWETLTEQMSRPRGAFTPSIFGNLIYLPGGFSTNSIEEFDPVKGTFQQLSVFLPGDGKTISFVMDTNLFILYHSYVFAIDLSQATKELKRGKKLEISDMWSPITPILSGRSALFWCFEETTSVMGIWRSITGKRHGICYSFNVDTMGVTEEERFEYLIAT